jgi:hypothetical protein
MGEIGIAIAVKADHRIRVARANVARKKCGAEDTIATRRQKKQY